MATLSIRPQRSNADFQLVARSFLSEQGLPLASVLPAAEIERIFRRHDATFGDTYNSVYNTAVVLWAFLSQVLADGFTATMPDTPENQKEFPQQKS